MLHFATKISQESTISILTHSAVPGPSFWTVKKHRSGSTLSPSAALRGLSHSALSSWPKGLSKSKPNAFCQGVEGLTSSLFPLPAGRLSLWPGRGTRRVRWISILTFGSQWDKLFHCGAFRRLPERFSPRPAYRGQTINEGATN